MIFDDSKIVNAESFVTNAKATVQRSGRLGLTKESAQLLDVKKGGRLLVAESDNGDLACVVLPPESNDTRGFRWQLASEYFSVNLKPFFDKVGLDYTDTSVTTIYDIIQTDESYSGYPVFKFHKRVIKRRFAKRNEDRFDVF